MPDLSVIEAIYFAALNLTAADRAAFLGRACADSEVRRAVERLLTADAEVGDFLEAPLSLATGGAGLRRLLERCRAHESLPRS